MVAKSKKPTKKEKALADELISIIPSLDEEGLAFLVEQARVHLYNMKVIELEEAAAKIPSSEKPKVKKQNTSDIDIIASNNGRTYDIVYNGKYKMLNYDEMLALVNIVCVKDSVEQISGRIYRWFMAERADIINDIPLNGLKDPLLPKITTIIRKKFTSKSK